MLNKALLNALFAFWLEQYKASFVHGITESEIISKDQTGKQYFEWKLLRIQAAFLITVNLIKGSLHYHYFVYFYPEGIL